MSKLGFSRCSRISLEVTCLLTRRHTVLRWHELNLGSCVKLGNLDFDVKREIQVEEPLVFEYQCKVQRRSNL